jgi:DNA-binding transcriptional LysR family regulator
MNVSLDDLATFAAVADARSFREISKARGLSPSAVSKAVRRLEAQLGVTLLERTTRSVFPTPAGARLLEHLAPALLQMEAAVAWATHPRGIGGETPGDDRFERSRRQMPELDRESWP